jgi:N-acetylmuramoyl-L-alanine amidase
MSLRQNIIACVLAILLGIGGAACAADSGPVFEIAARHKDAAIATGLRFGLYKERTRVVLDLSAEPGYRIFILQNPDRVVIDLDQVYWEGVADRGNGAGLVRRFSRQSVSDDRTRLILETGGPTNVFNVFTIPARDQRLPRMVIDLDTTTATAAKVAAADPVIIDTMNHKLRFAARAETATVSMTAPMSAALLTPAPRPNPKPKSWRVVLDAGHGGADPGAIAINGVYEKQVTLRVAQRVKQELERRGRYDVVLTRDSDRFIPLRQRVDIARDHQAEFFISLHADSHPDQAVRGASVYTLSETASDKEAERLAGHENRVDAIGGVDLGTKTADVANILIDLAMRETMNQSKKAAGLLVDSFETQDIRLVRNGHRAAGFMVLKAADVPSLLIEMGYLSNAKDAVLLADEEYIDRLVIAIADGIETYFAGQQPVQQAANPKSE